ncbi:general secretion pathway protein H [Rhizomicrobium palustre]|uniref:General secretion pathway protein H n=1 Tax=Rhizomicrobium palustre TaxID=189966 RepID=A0A846N083_9PROT|nr:prepilin-type N-terminal cleavage/methylation domain-containing protein [Rhizomicrobium palustre]NIK88973.1 general secretion pathway protein H [Rhizomicrobium palustre]
MSAIGDTSSEKGFTLLEVLVVLSISAMASMLVFPQLDRAFHVLALRRAAFGFAADLRKARADAIMSGQSQAVTLDAKGDGYSTPAGWHSASHGVRFAGSDDVLLFYADGTSSGGQISVNAFRRYLDVRVDPITGVVAVGHLP